MRYRSKNHAPTSVTQFSNVNLNSSAPNTAKMRATRALLGKRSVWKGMVLCSTDTPPLIIRRLTRHLHRAKHRPVRAPTPHAMRQTAVTDVVLWHSLPLVRPKEGQTVPPIRTQARSATILPSFVGLNFEVYNGKVYNPITITEDMVGHKLGEFST